LEEYALDNFCCTRGTYHFEKTCPEFLNSFYALLLPPGTPEKENNGVEEENYEDEESELKEVQHPPNLILHQDETKLYNMDVDEIEEEKHENEESEVEDLIKGNHPPNFIPDQDEAEMDEMEDCIEIDPYLLNKEDLSISTSTIIASTLTEATIGEFLDKDEQIEKDSTPNPMVNHLSNPEKLVMSLNSIINNSCFETFFVRSNVELSFFANSYKQSELLPCNQIVELNHINSWTLYFDISRNKHGTDVGCLIIHPCGKRTYSVIQLEPEYTDTVDKSKILMQGLKKAINMNVKYIEVFGGPKKVIKQVKNSMHFISNCMGNFQQEVWNLISHFKVFKLKSIPHTFNTSTDMFKLIVRLENHSNLRDIIEKPWTCKTTNEDIKSLWQKKHRILFSPNLLVKIKLNKLLAARIIVSIHARKGRTVRLKNMKDLLNDDIWLYQNNILGEVFPSARSGDSSNYLRVVNVTYIGYSYVLFTHL
jgi:hypothetical protein